MSRTAGILLTAVSLLLSGCGINHTVSKVIFDDIYRLKDADNIEFAFSKDSMLVVSQKGIYELAESSTGEPLLRICLADISRELPEDYDFTEYRMKKQQKQIILTLATDAFELDANPMVLSYLEGEDGLLSGSAFEGVYQIGADTDSYQYLFEEDGSVVLQIRQRYYADEGRITLSDHGGSTDYLYKAEEDTLVIQNLKGEPILNLERMEE